MSGPIDRDALIDLIGDDVYDTNEQFADRILALVQPDPRIDAVRALHVQIGGRTVRREMCRQCNAIEWPCPTLRALGDDTKAVG